MKINEVLNASHLEEGPLDFAKKVGAGLKGLKQGGLAGAKQSWAAQSATSAQSGINKQLLAKALERYNQFAAPITAAGQQVTIPQAQAWFNKFSGMSPTSTPKSTDPVGIQQWLIKEIPAYMAAKTGREGTGVIKGQTIEKDGQQFKWDGTGWRTAKGTYPNMATTQQLTQMAISGQGAPAQQTQPQMQTQVQVPQGEAKSPTDVVNRLMKLHPTWVPEITKQLLNKQSVTAR